jgi:hypothetical protein
MGHPFRRKWGTAKKATLVTAMISEVPTSVKIFLVRGGNQHHFVSIIIAFLLG